MLEIHDLTVRYGSVGGVRGVSLEAERGAITGILGANGAGKTTTLLGIHARVPRITGRVVLDGRDVTGLDTPRLVRAGVALCPENRRLFPNMTVADNLLLGAYGRPRREQRTLLSAGYERFPFVAERRDEMAGRLSGGQQQIVAIARALMSQPKMLLLDEPSSGLSPVAIDEVRQILEAVTDDGTSVLLVEQNVKLVQALCHRAYVLAHGTVRDSGLVSDLLEGARVADAYLGGLDIIDADSPDEHPHERSSSP